MLRFAAGAAAAAATAAANALASCTMLCLWALWGTVISRSMLCLRGAAAPSGRLQEGGWLAGGLAMPAVSPMRVGYSPYLSRMFPLLWAGAHLTWRTRTATATMTTACVREAAPVSTRGEWWLLQHTASLPTPAAHPGQRSSRQTIGYASLNHRRPCNTPQQTAYKLRRARSARSVSS